MKPKKHHPQWSGKKYDSSSLIRRGGKGDKKMPGVDYREVQSRVPMGKVLDWLGFVANGVRGEQEVCRCFRCGFAGNQIQLWAERQEITVYEAAVDLCRRAGVEVPWLKRW